MCDLTDFSPRSDASRGLTVGELRRYIELPFSAKMSWPPQNTEVQNDLREYVKKNGLDQQSIPPHWARARTPTPPKWASSTAPGPFMSAAARAKAEAKVRKKTITLQRLESTLTGIKRWPAPPVRASSSDCSRTSRSHSLTTTMRETSPPPPRKDTRNAKRKPKVNRDDEEDEEKKPLTDMQMRFSMSDLKFRNRMARDERHANLADLRIYHSESARATLRPTSAIRLDVPNNYVRDESLVSLTRLQKNLLGDYADMIAASVVRRGSKQYRNIVSFLSQDAERRGIRTKEERIEVLLDYAVEKQDRFSMCEEQVLYLCVRILEHGEEPFEAWTKYANRRTRAPLRCTGSRILSDSESSDDVSAASPRFSFGMVTKVNNEAKATPHVNPRRKVDEVKQGLKELFRNALK